MAIQPQGYGAVAVGIVLRDSEGTQIGVVTERRRDVANEACMSLNWVPYRYLRLSRSLLNARLSSTAPGLNYNGNNSHTINVNVNVNAQFSY